MVCKGPHYALSDYPAGGLFLGEFGEMHTRNPSVEGGNLAASVGFKGTKSKRLEAACATELDFHFIDERTAAFALNNYIYTVRKP